MHVAKIGIFRQGLNISKLLKLEMILLNILLRLRAQKWTCYRKPDVIKRKKIANTML